MAKYFLMPILAALALAEQPQAERPTSYPSRSLPWGKLNFLHTTDIHGWLAGHFKEPHYSADWGDYISFVQRMREKADSLGVDLLVVDTGDRIEGNGLYDASEPKGKYSYDIFNQLDIDILNSGNHELYKTYTVASEVSETVLKSNGNYIASNLDYIDSQTGKQVPLARRYRVFTTKNQGIKVAVFGFMFDFDRNAKNSLLQPVEDTLKEDWFQNAIREDVEIFLVATHAPLNSREHKIIHAAIRSHNKETPIQFFGAHTHKRDFRKYDSKSYGIQSGRYMETVGWMSIDWKNNTDNLKTAKDLSFQRRYIDPNVNGYQYHSGLNKTTFPTARGRNVSTSIYEARKILDLDYTFGCAPRDLFFKAPHPSNQSVLTWLEKEVFPTAIIKPERANTSRFIVLNSLFVRFDILKGAYTRDTNYMVTPFVSSFDYIKDVPYKNAKYAIDLLNGDDRSLFPSSKSTFEDPPRVLHVSEENFIEPGGQPLPRGYVTVDDAGNDGDDTLHTPVVMSLVPKFLKSEVIIPAEREPDVIDLVYSNFLQPYVFSALSKTGLNYTLSDAEVYTKETVDKQISKWVQENWPCQDSRK
ncbi:Uncharacterized protein K3495_g12268 [Podosphaera aphanis]|nr:Uncharacterized protein K3495_g12268 [Podosphaera aphanis]